MSYYILPKNNNIIDIVPDIKNNNIVVYTSCSLYNFYDEGKNQLRCLIKTDETISILKNLLKNINTYEYIFSIVPGFKHPISKLKTKTSLFYDLIEIFNTLNTFDFWFNKNLNCLHISENYVDSNFAVNYFRQNQTNNHYNFEDINEEIYCTVNDTRYDSIFYEIKNSDNENLNDYILNVIQSLMIILKYQSNNGICIIKINHIFHKPIIDILYILCSLYEKVYITKPNTSNVTTFDKYIVCKNFILNNNKKETYKNYYFKLANLINDYLQKNGNNILSLFNFEIPLYFINKIDDANIIIGQQQLESIDQIINIFKNKNKDEKIENIKKSNIQKSILWCEKFKIPHNKITEKVNIFLPLKKEKSDIDIVDDIVNDVLDNVLIDVISNEL